MERSRFGLRLSISFCVGLLVSFLAAFTAWSNSSGWDPDRQRFRTYHSLMGLEMLTRDYKGRTGAFPESLAQLGEALGGVPRSIFTDEWQRPFEYSTDGTDVVIVSRGRDGLPGGQGLDSDISNKDPHPSGVQPTMPQFLLEIVHAEMILSWLGCGLFAFLTCLVTIWPSDLSGKGLKWLAAKLALTLLAAMLLAEVMSFLEIPMGGH